VSSGFELRVHGIGDHGPLSAIGDPIMVTTPPGQQEAVERDSDVDKELVNIFRAPEATNHTVHMLSWSPSSHKNFTLLWWLALPATLVNVAGHMRPQPGGWSARIHAAAIAVTSLLLTLGYFLWSTAILEQVARLIPGWSWLESAVVWLAASIVVIASVVHIARFALNKRGLALAGIHVVAVLASAAWLVKMRPTRLPPRGILDACKFELYDSCEPHMNVLSTFMLSSTAIVLVFGTACLALWWRRKHDRTDVDGLAVAGVLLLAPVVLMNTIWALLRGAVKYVVLYLDKVLQTISTSRGLQESDRILTPTETGFDRQTGAYDSLDVVPIFAVGLLISVLVVFAGLLFRGEGRRKANPDYSGQQLLQKAIRRAQRVHDYVRSLTTQLVATALIATLLWVVWCAFMLWLLANPTGDKQSVVRLFVDLLTLAAAAGFFAVWLLPGARTRIASVGDIIGYWPVAWSPLAGTSYRSHVTEKLTKWIAADTYRPLVVVGHSQGSVISLDVIRLMSTTHNLSKLTLVTCGSPLYTLYTRFFPRHYTLETLASIQQAGVTWHNFWRDTDPIASPMPDGCGAIDHRILDEVVEIRKTLRWWRHAKLHKHGGYWTNDEQTEIVRGALPRQTE
jgi:hypothetical protein